MAWTPRRIRSGPQPNRYPEDARIERGAAWSILVDEGVVGGIACREEVGVTFHRLPRRRKVEHLAYRTLTRNLSRCSQAQVRATALLRIV